MALRDYKTVVFFGETFSQYAYIKAEFAQYPSVRVFQTSIADELGQILSQSILTAILVKNTKFIKQLVAEDILSMKKAGVRFYFLNNDAALSREEIQKLSVMNITTLSSLSDIDLRAKLEMFLLNKLRLSDKKAEVEEGSVPKQSYFTHFKKINGEWLVYVSTHEQEREIETLFQKSWTIYCMDLLTQADEVVEVKEEADFSSDYLCILYPHSHPDTSRGLSIMHVKKDANFAETYQRALSFLAKI